MTRRALLSGVALACRGSGAVAGSLLTPASQLRNDLAGARVGIDLRLTILRNGRRSEIRVTVEEARAVG